MKYLRRNENGEAIFNCPDCGCELHASGELLDYLTRRIMGQWGKNTANKMTPEQRRERAIKAVRAREAKRALINGTVRKSE